MHTIPHILYIVHAKNTDGIEAGKQAELGTVLCKIACNHRALLFRARGLSVTELQLVTVDHLPTKVFKMIA